MGDRHCCALDYVPLGSERQNIRTSPEWLVGKHVVIGGGGLLHQSYYGCFRQLLDVRRNQSPDSRLIIWGVGMNLHNTQAMEYPSWLAEFDLVGLRDHGNPYDYVPCPSCLSMEFDRPRPAPSQRWVVYEHRGQPVRNPAFSDSPRQDNGGRLSLREVLDFLATGETVVTSSFHGAYWSLLLGRAVLLYKPFSNRFLSFPVRLPTIGDEPLKGYSPVVFPQTYLTDCRQRNHVFAARVCQLLDLPSWCGCDS